MKEERKPEFTLEYKRKNLKKEKTIKRLIFTLGSLVLAAGAAYGITIGIEIGKSE